ncbi:MAG: cell wall metabolism sensor histidine kinase WalK [Chloroflexi bacterium]|nr:cell wall metabolism sensor histidine kinase WalK [Chloroflexota bacterium]
MGQQPVDNNEKKVVFISVRWKLLIGFTVLFSLVFALAFYWFFNTATDLALQRIQEDLKDTVQAAVMDVNVDELLALADEGLENPDLINTDGFSDDLRFDNQLDWLETVHQIEPRAWPYVYIPDEGENDVFFVTDLLARYDVSRSAGFLEPYQSTGPMISGLDELTFRLVNVGPVKVLENFLDWLEERNAPAGLISFVDSIQDWLSNYFPKKFGMYEDKFGRWVSAYTPITNSDGELVAAMGIDFEADYVETVRQSILDRVAGAFTITYIILFILVYIISDVFTRPILGLTQAAELIGEGNYETDLSEAASGRYRDEIGMLAEVFTIMVGKVHKREQTLLRQVAKLKIEIDESKQQEEVSDIVDSDFFRDLQSRANDLRKRRGKTKKK